VFTHDAPRRKIPGDVSSRRAGLAWIGSARRGAPGSSGWFCVLADMYMHPYSLRRPL
jgi:hypothetical protein